ncbi:RICIN domain-containing protein [Kitasatospora sp. NPDC059463]|uniref:RICIN domain-containing protein n=1 Tax=unclassified Kitasatospora TaxID=2633591 RepID=UPI0036A938DF
MLSSRWSRAAAVGVLAGVTATGPLGQPARATAPDSLVTLRQAARPTMFLTSTAEGDQAYAKAEAPDHTAQRWLLRPDGNGAYTIRDPSGSSCLATNSTEDYSWVALMACDSAQYSHRLWKLVREGTGFLIADAGGTSARFDTLSNESDQIILWLYGNYPDDQIWLPVFEPR